MSTNTCAHEQNPELAGSLWTTGEDYMKFLENLYYHQILPAEVIDWLYCLVYGFVWHVYMTLC